MHNCEGQKLCKHWIKGYDHVRRVQNANKCKQIHVTFYVHLLSYHWSIFLHVKTLEPANTVHMKNDCSTSQMRIVAKYLCDVMNAFCL